MIKDNQNKGFTLIELLAVIVILAIIAIIAVPIVLNIINDAKKSSNKRSIDLYAKAIENAIAREEINGNGIEPGDLDEEFLKTVEYNGSKVLCKTNKLYKDGTVYLADCKVDNLEVEYTYGKIQEETSNQIYKYYSISSGNIGGSLPEDKSLTQSFDYKTYFLLESEDNETVSAVYSCFNMNEKEYCLNVINPNAYNSNVKILENAFKDVVYDEDTDTERGGCSTSYNDILEYDFYSCTDTLGEVSVGIDSTGGSTSRVDGFICIAYSEGKFNCRIAL